MSSLSSTDLHGQDPEATQFHPHADYVPAHAGNPDDRDDDDDTDLADTVPVGDDGDDDDLPPANAGAIGLPCTKGEVRHVAGRPNWSLCAVVIETDPTDPTDTDYIRDGQELCAMHARSLAFAVCDGYALDRAHMERTFAVAVPGCTHLVVNNNVGREVHRRPLLVAG